jgi:hypothetical protein
MLEPAGVAAARAVVDADAAGAEVEERSDPGEEPQEQHLPRVSGRRLLSQSLLLEWDKWQRSLLCGSNIRYRSNFL